MNDLEKMSTKRLLDYIQRCLRKTLENHGVSSEEGWDPEEVHQMISRKVREIIPEDGNVIVKTPSLEQLVALRLMGKDIKSTLHLSVEFSPPKPLDVFHTRIVVGNKTE